MTSLFQRAARHPGTLLAASLGLAGTALWVGRSARRAERHHPPAGLFVEVEGQRLHFLEAGSGPPVVLLHGNGAQAADFVGSGLVQALSAHCRVIAFDRPGFGYSERPRDGVWTPERQAALIARACAALDIERPVLVGHSWGTMVALAGALDPALAPRGLVLLSGYYFPTLRPDALLFAAPRIPLLGDVLRYTLSAITARMILPLQLRQIFAPHDVPQAFERAVPRRMTVRPNVLRASAEESALMPLAAARLARRLGEIRIPVAIFAGDGDLMVRQRRQAQALARQLPQSELHWLPGEGHMLHYFAGPQIVQAVARMSGAAQTSAPPPAAAEPAASPVPAAYGGARPAAAG